MRRRRLDALTGSPPWPGKGPVLARERAQYDHCLEVAAEMLDVPVPEKRAGPGQPLPAELRALLEDRLAHAGLDVHAPRWGVTGDIISDGDLFL